MQVLPLVNYLRTGQLTVGPSVNKQGVMQEARYFQIPEVARAAGVLLAAGVAVGVAASYGSAAQFLPQSASVAVFLSKCLLLVVRLYICLVPHAS